MSHQSFSATTARFLNPDSAKHQEIKHDDKQTIEGNKVIDSYKI